jgi:predicted nucleotidyltransferase
MGSRIGEQGTQHPYAFDPSPFRAVIARKRQRRLAETSRRVRRAREFLAVIVDAFIRIDPAIDRIVLFGSLARGIPRSINFDIDIAVRSERYLQLVAWALDQEWKIDVVDLDSLDGTILRGVDAKAELLYER